MRTAAVLLVALSLALFGCDKSKAPEGADKPTAKADAPAKTDADPDGAKADDGNAAVADVVADVVTKDRPQDSASPAEVGKPAPDFVLADLSGKEVRLSDFKGKPVVLEWFNPGCPFVKYAHTEGPLVDMASKEVDKGVVWLAINSGAEGMQGFEVADNEAMVDEFGIKHPVLRDPDGTVGHLYGAEKTPHMYLIDDAGTLLYAGGIDNAPFGEVDGGGDRIGYLDEALAAMRDGKPVQTPTAKAWGCTVKYAKKG